MINIQHEKDKFLLTNRDGRVSVQEGQEGNITSAPDGTEYSWYDTHEEAVTAAKAIDSEYVDPIEEREKELEALRNE